MPKRVLDGEGLWRSEKLAQVEPTWIRAEYANLVPLALANGVFEAEPRRVWSVVYSYNRPDITPEKAEQILNELERAKLLFRWTDAATGKMWGYWIGIDKPGRLPGQSRRGKNEAIGPQPPTDELRKFMESNGIQKFPDGNEKLPGSGSGSGLGSGSGDGFQERELRKPDLHYEPEIDDDSEALVNRVGHTHPANSHLKGKALSQEQEQAIAEAIQRDGKDAVLAGTLNLKDAVAKWPKAELRFIPNPVRFYRQSEYLKDPASWEKPTIDGGSNGSGYQPRPAASIPLSEQMRRTGRPDAAND